MRRVVGIVVLVTLGSAGLFNGMSLVSDPSGRTLGLTVEMLPEWHTWDYRYSGLFVLVALGIAPILCAGAMIVDVPGTTVGSMAVGAVAVLWVVWQIVVLEVRAPWAHVALVAAGVVLIVTARPRVDRAPAPR